MRERSRPDTKGIETELPGGTHPDEDMGSAPAPTRRGLKLGGIDGNFLAEIQERSRPDTKGIETAPNERDDRHDDQGSAPAPNTKGIETWRCHVVDKHLRARERSRPDTKGIETRSNTWGRCRQMGGALPPRHEGD